MEQLQAIEDKLNRVMSMVDSISPLLALIPGAAPVVAVAETAMHAADTVINTIQGEPTAPVAAAPVPPLPDGTDAAALAVKSDQESTGNLSLDVRLANIETRLAAVEPLLEVLKLAGPLLKYLAREFGFEDPATQTTAA